MVEPNKGLQTLLRGHWTDFLSLETLKFLQSTWSIGMRKKRIFHTLWLAVLLGLVTQASATPFDLGTTSIEIPEPAGFVEVSPKMRQLWQIVQAGQGYNRIIAFYIPENEEKAALAGKDVALPRGFNIQIQRSLQEYSLTEDDFQQVIKQVEALISTRQVDAVQAAIIEQFNGNLQEITGAAFSQTENLTLPAHINRPGYYAFSEISTIEVASQNGDTQQDEVTTTTAAILVKGKLLMCYTTGSKGDLEWTRSAVKQWVESIIAENPS